MIKTIKELRDPELLLVTDSQDVRAVKDTIGFPALEYDGFFVKVENGDYSEVWGFLGTIPYVWKHAERLRP